MKPWLPNSLLIRLNEIIQPNHRVFEWGSGGSTVWFARRAKEVYSIEHDPSWHKKVGQQLKRNRLNNVSLSRIPISPAYWESIVEYPDRFFDIVLVDGRERVKCFHLAVEKTDGVLVLDNGLRKRYREARESMEHLMWKKEILEMTPEEHKKGRVVPANHSLAYYRSDKEEL